MSEFFLRLKQRKLVQWALAYVAAAFALLQGIDIIAQQFGWPEGVRRGITLALVIGFLVTLVLAWYHGERGAQKVTGAELLILALLLSLGGVFLWRHSTAAAPPSPLAALPSPVATPPAVIPAKSIAVLPFENLSDEKANAYFAEGVQDEILTRLAHVADLKVISRTSTAKYKSAPDNLREIAQQLGVANILEGSVQKAGEQVRITAQLINAQSDSHLWANTYDRKLSDTFAVESDVAQTIVSALEAKLSGAEQKALSARPTENTEAYQLYLKGRFFWNKRTGADLKIAAGYFERAVAEDPSYASAYAGLAQADLLIPVFGAGRPTEYFPKAEVATQRAVALDDQSAEGQSALAMIRFFEFRFQDAEHEFHRALQANPNYATAHHWLGNSLYTTLGRFDEAIKESQRAVELDPLSLIINADLGSTLMIARRYDDAIAQLRRTLALDGNFAYAHWNLGEALYLKGDTAGAIAEYEKARALDNDPEILALLGRTYAETGRKGEALALLQQLQRMGDRQYVRSYLYTILYIGLRDNQKAIDYLDKAGTDDETPDTTWLKVDPLFDPLRSEPRFQNMVARLFSR